MSDRLAEIERTYDPVERLYHVPDEAIDECVTWLIEEVKRLRAEGQALREWDNVHTKAFNAICDDLTKANADITRLRLEIETWRVETADMVRELEAHRSDQRTSEGNCGSRPTD